MKKFYVSCLLGVMVFTVNLLAENKEYPAASHITKNDVLNVNAGCTLYGATEQYELRYIGESRESPHISVMHFSDSKREAQLFIRKLREYNHRDVLFQMKFNAPMQRNKTTIIDPPYETVKMSYGNNNTLVFSTYYSCTFVKKHNKNINIFSEKNNKNLKHYNFIYDGTTDIQQAIDAGHAIAAKQKKYFGKKSQK